MVQKDKNKKVQETKGAYNIYEIKIAHCYKDETTNEEKYFYKSVIKAYDFINGFILGNDYKLSDKESTIYNMMTRNLIILECKKDKNYTCEVRINKVEVRN